MSARESAYDEHVAPLMSEIIRICKVHGIPVFATFQIDDGEDPEDPSFCTTAILPTGCAPVLTRVLLQVKPPSHVVFTTEVPS